MVSKAFLYHALDGVYKQALETHSPADMALAEEVRRVAGDPSIFTPEEIEENRQQLAAIEYTVQHHHFTCYTDGAREGIDVKRSGGRLAAAAAVIYEGDTMYHKTSVLLPPTYHGEPMTSHGAEYMGLIHCLTTLEKQHPHPEEVTVTMFSDSQNMVDQLNMKSRTRTPLLRRLNKKAQAHIRRFKKVNIAYIPRSENTYADQLVTDMLDRPANSF